ncbi:MAG: DMT family transporter [Ruminococcus sp.]|nr:DMT family transporter [Ruminococcus sp.]
MGRKFHGSIMLLAAALIWGTAFVAQSEGMRYVEPFTYNSIRTLLGGMVLIPVIAAFRKGGSKGRNYAADPNQAPLRTTIIGGILCGVFLFIASSFQQTGISMTTAGKAGFITALYIIIVPLIELILYRKSTIMVWICVLLAALGFYLLCMSEGFQVGMGDLLVLCSAVFFAMHIMVIDHFNSRQTDGMLMSCIQFLTAGTFMAISMFLFEKPQLSLIWDAKYTILYAGVMSCGIAYTLQILGQRHTNPTAATLLMSLESVFAALSGWLLLHEALTPRELTGCGLVFAAVVLAQLKSPEHTTNQIKTEMKS